MQQKPLDLCYAHEALRENPIDLGVEGLWLPFYVIRVSTRRTSLGSGG